MFCIGKSLLLLLLVVTQVMPWTASPLFLCLGSDGSVCLDGGPATCTCCRDHEHDEDPCCAENADDVRHEHRLPARIDDQGPASISHDDCDCAHVLLSHDARFVRRARTDGDMQTVALRLMTSVSTVRAEVPAPALGTFDGLRRPDALPLLLSERAPIVLRC
jgi:hypothetical protein